MAKVKYTSEAQFVSDEMTKADAANADMASVGYDGNKYAMLVNSGMALSQMSDGERKYIKDHYQYTPATTYKNNAMDQYLASVGLPPSSDLSKYRTAYSKYTAGGGIEQNYGNLSDDQWKKINELWQKDWEYGLTDTDYKRRAAGLAPSSYDDMYEDTLLDDELKARGLPPSKLLNGKLGETYNKWASDYNEYNRFNEAVARRYYEHNGVGTESSSRAAASSAVGNVVGALGGTPNADTGTTEYTYAQAYADTLADPQWASFRKDHGTAGVMAVPTLEDPAYIMTGKDSLGNKIEITDENGDPVYDTEKWEKDLDKALDNNAKIDADEFALTLEKSQAFFDQYGSMVRADIATEQWFTKQGVKEVKPEDYLGVYSSFLSGYMYNEGQGFTLDTLYPGVEFSDEDKAALQTYVDKANFILLNSGYDAAQEYFENGEFAKDLKDLTDSRIVASMREMYKDVPGYDKKTDAELLHQYYTDVGETYMMTDEETAKLENGEMSLQSYMMSKCPDVESAHTFAEDRLLNRLQKEFGISSREELNTRLETRRKAEELASSLMVNLGADYAQYPGDLLTMSDDDYDAFWQSKFDEIAQTDTDGHYTRQAQRQKDEADKARVQVKEADPTIYKDGYSSAKLEELRDNWNALEVSYYADAVSYTPDFATKTADMDYVNRRFEQIASAGYTNYGEDVSNLYALATDDEKRKLVYLADQYGTTRVAQGGIVYDTISGSFTYDETARSRDALAGYAGTYLDNLMHSWDAQRRIDKQAEAGHLYVDTGSTFGNVMLELVTGANITSYLFGGVGEGVLNLLTDTAKIASGYDFLSSSRLTYFSDVTANNAATIDEYTKVGSFVYQMVPSMVQSMASMALAVATDGASEAFTLAAMAAESYSGAVDQALRNGASTGQAYLFGLANGVNEVLFEKMSLDHFVSGATVFTQTMKAASKSAQKSTASAFAKTLLKRMAVQGLIEGSEELFTSLANNFAESLVLGYNSSFNKTVEHYVASGMSREEAEKKASADVVKAVMMDFVGGLVSGALMSFGGDMVMSHRGRVFMDTTGISQFMNQTMNLSQISVQDALKYATENLEKDANGKYTADSAKAVYEELIKRGADASVLLRVRTELFNEKNSTPEVTTPIETMISDQRNTDKKLMLKSAEKYVYNKQANKQYAGNQKGKSNVSREQLQKVVNAYVDELSNRVTRIDVAQIQSAMRATQAEFLESINTLAGFKESNARAGYRALTAYRQSLPEDAQNAIAQNAEKYKNTFNTANMNGAQAGHYAVMAATIEYAVGNGDALTGLNTVFGGSASVATEAVSNACLNSDGATAERFVDRVLAGVGMCTQTNGGHLFEASRNGVNPTAYVATQMALARSMPENSMSRSTYDHIMKYGASAEALDLLTAANIITTNGVDAEASRKIMGGLMTSDQMQEAADKYTKAVQRYNDKLKIAEAHRQADAQALESENARIAGQEETVRVLDAQLQETQGSDKGVVDALAKARNALAGYVTARDNLVAEQNKRQASTQADMNEAKRAYDSAVREYQMAMFQHSAAYVRRLGAQMETMKAHGSITDTEFKRVTLEVMYGAAEDLNSVEQRIVSAEKTAAVALGRALGVDVECVKFDDAFFAKYNIDNPDKTAKGCAVGGKVFLNTVKEATTPDGQVVKVMTADVGSLTDQVLLHEIGHAIEQSTDSYKKYAAFALDYFKKRDGKNKDGKYKVDVWRTQLEQQGMSKEGALKEVVAEFTRQVALGDARAISALCKSAPKMSMRIFQWLTNTKSRMSKANAAQSRVVNDAQRAFAKALKTFRSSQTGENATNVSEFAPNRTAMDNALRQLEARVNEQANAQQTQTTQTTEQTAPVTEQQTTPAAQTEQTEAEEAEQTAAETTETPVEEQRTTETPARRPISPFSAAGEEALRRNAPKTKAEVEDMIQRTTAGYTGEGIETVADELVERDGVYYDRYGNAQDEHGNAVSQSEAETAEAAPVQDPVEDFADVEDEEAIDTSSKTEYNNNEVNVNASGETVERRVRSALQGSEGQVQYDDGQRAEADARADSERVEVSQPEGDRGLSQNGLDGRDNRGENLRLLNDHREAFQKKDSGHFEMKETDDHQRFSDALSNMRENNIEGASVDPKSVDELSGMTTLLTDDNSAGVAVAPNGNITGLFKNRKINSNKNAGIDLMFAAIASGGDRCDCYGPFLANTYANAGMVPVARVQYARGFNPEMDAYIDEMRAKGKAGFETDPDIYFMRVQPGMSFEDLVNAYESGDTKQYTKEELDALPLFEDSDGEYGYDRAEAYRDALASGIQSKSTRGGSKAQYYTEYDTEYLDLARRYESGDKSVEAELRKAVQSAAKRNGYVLATFHGTSEYFNTFNMGVEGIHLGTEAVAKQVANIRYNNRSKQTAYEWKDLRGRIKEIGTETREEILKKAWTDADDYTDEGIEPYSGSVEDDESVVRYVDRVEQAVDRKHGYRLYLNTFDRNVGERIIPIYAKIDNPLVINGDLGYWTPFEIAETILDMAVGKTSKESAGGRPINITGSEVKLTKEQKRALLDISQLSFVRFTEEKFRMAWNELANVFESMGFDGIKYRNEFEGNKNSYSYIALRPSDVKSAELVTKDDKGNIIPLSERFKTDRTGSDAWKNEDIRYYTEYDPQTQAVADTLDGMSDSEKRRVGDPRIIETDHGYVVARMFNSTGMRSGNPQLNAFGNTKQNNIAMIAPSAEFDNGDVGKAVPMQRCTALAIPNTDAYAEARADARDAGASVYAYDPSDPTNFDRAIDRAANMRHAEYMPAMGYDEWLERYNAINPQSSRPIPQQTMPTNRVNKVVQTAADSNVTTDETYQQRIPSWLQNGTGTYTPISNAKTLNRARGVIERAGSLKQAAADLHHDVAEGNGKATDLLARAELLYAEMQNDNTLSLVEQERIFGDLCMISSDAGRALQLVSELKNMTPEGHISYIEQVGRRMSERHQRRTGQQTDLSLTKEEKDAYRRATTKEERDAVDKEVSERWAEETSKLGILDRIRNWRYFAMLGNPRTHFRNMIGNTLMMPITRAKDSINTMYQLADVKRGKMSAEDRTTTFITNVDESTKTYVAEQLKKALPIMQGVSTKYIEEATKAAQDGEVSEGKLREIWRKLREDQPSTHITQGNTGFGRFINALSSFNTNALEMEDALYLGLRFKSSMYQQIQARGLDVDSITDEQLNNMVNYAMQEALRATFRDASALADALNKLARTNKATELAMEAIVPFKKTPINIAKRSMEYSPLGLIQGTYKLISNNRAYQQKIDRINASNYTEETKQSELKKAEETYKMQRIEAIDRLAAGTTGSALYIMGIIAASLGWVSIGRKDDEGTQFENALGKNNYSLNIGDVSIDLSAFSPAAVPLLMGTATWNAFRGEHEESEPIVSGLISALAESVDPITEMSMLSGIADALSGSSYSNYSDGKNTRWFGTIAGNALESYVGQFVPTFVGQTARIADPYARSYSAGNDYWASKALGPEIGGAVKNLQNKVGLGWLSEPKVDLHGEPVKNYTNWGDFILNWANNRVLPATIKVDQKNDIDEELVRLYGVVDSDKLFPTKPSRNIGSYKDPKTGKNVNLKLDNDREYMQYQQEVGQTTYDLLEDLMLSMAYQRMSDADKAAAIEKVIDQAKSATKKRWKAQMMADRK